MFWEIWNICLDFTDATSLLFIEIFIFYRINSKVSEYLSSVEIQNNTEQQIVGIEEHHGSLHLQNVVNIHINWDLRADVGGG